jgi:D-amino-acid dehydrogenase
MIYNTLILGAGMVGVSCALHAQKRGLSVALVDRKEPGSETSYGNSGVIDADSLLPTSMPRDPLSLIKFALNNQTKAHYSLAGVLKNPKWLYDYFKFSSAQNQRKTALDLRELFSHSLSEHKAMAEAANASHYIRDSGWLKLYRSEASLNGTEVELTLARELGLSDIKLSQGEVLELEPHLKPVFKGGVWSKHASTCSNPGELTKSYARLFAKNGGHIAKGDALTLTKTGNLWQVLTEQGVISAETVVIAMGAWSVDITAKFGYAPPLSVKRGYHMHYKPVGNAFLNRQVCDVDVGYVLCPMEQGTRLTTGAEISPLGASKTPVQLARDLPYARKLFDLGEAVEHEPWLGNRPAFADSRPVIGHNPMDETMLVAFGHGHWGFTQGPATGRAISDLLVKAKPYIDLAAYSPNRFPL